MKGRYIKPHSRKGKKVKAHWRYTGGGYSKVHPTAKPVKLVKRAATTV